ncbi:AFL046Wp [Eremothecium gossypii ATCC 10895]|uniref:Imidazole glycerol phosphate synthase hisHF n=1 Tax=Eremothecium gossypii (strain ATCC 10895 / CBS 109.51 / FGSC 9923 / NRRL Y-1056) TaxID=284811 RepID=Q754W3_EREGS|nr:AFL046Wp [Eremothecium gossypii ATCC 10895]AAS53326.1 AFL046Wp [Eremothecium gossypii ATCC 10895]AEY97637.1 FAFL046Wp [Eremothecium gossypii FDAG1]
MVQVVHIVDVESGNLQSITNAIEHLGYEVKLIRSGADPELDKAETLILPGVGNFGHFTRNMRARGFVDAISSYIASGRPLMGICVGLQVLFRSSEEDPGAEGLALVDMSLSRFRDESKPVPEIGWNTLQLDGDQFFGLDPCGRYYFVHSYAAMLANGAGRLREQGWRVATARYGDERFVAALARGNLFATQFHPEKSGKLGLQLLANFLKQQHPSIDRGSQDIELLTNDYSNYGLTRRIIACLDVRANDEGDLVVTKGDQYDVRDKQESGAIRNLGKPVELAQLYYEQGADEITFLNITSFKDCPLRDAPMLEVLRLAAKTTFVPLTVGGGIRDIVDPDGTRISALDVAGLYFRSGADKVSIGTDAVYAAERYYEAGTRGDGSSPIETISKAYGSQAVVISVDPKRVYVDSPDDTPNKTIESKYPNSKGQRWCWYQCTLKGGRECSKIGVWELVRACEALGAGEILLNCIDRDGTNVGYDLELLKLVKYAVKIPVVASSGAGKPEHFQEAFLETGVDACLGAGIFHRGEYTVREVKDHLSRNGLKVRLI